MPNKSVCCHALAIALVVGSLRAEAFPVTLGKHVNALKAQVEVLPVGVELTVEHEDRLGVMREVTAMSRAEFELSTPEPVQVRLADVRGVTQALAAQLSGGNPNASTSKHHLLRVLVIALTVGLAFLIFAAIELRKS